MSWDSVQVPRHCQCAFLWNWDTFKKLKWDQTVQTHPFLWSHKTVTLSTRNRKKWSWKDLSWWGYRAKDLKNELLLCVLFFFFFPTRCSGSVSAQQEFDEQDTSGSGGNSDYPSSACFPVQADRQVPSHRKSQRGRMYLSDLWHSLRV